MNGEQVRIEDVAPPTDGVLMGHGNMAGNGT